MAHLNLQQKPSCLQDKSFGSSIQSMIIMNYLTLFLFLGCARAALANPLKPQNDKVNFKSYSLPQKLCLLAMSTALPEKFGKIPCSSLFSEEDIPSVDVFFTDVRTLLTQLIKVDEEIPLPEIEWNGVVDPCNPECGLYNNSVGLKTGNTTITGQKLTTSVNELTLTTFRNLFTVPSLVWEYPDLFFNISLAPSEIGFIWKHLQVSISNLELETSFDYEFVTGLGIQIKNLNIEFSIDELSLNLLEWCEYWWDVEDFCDPIDPLLDDLSPSFRDVWETLKVEYQDSLQFQINCLLSEARVDPEGCGKTVGNVTEKYLKLNVIQLFQTVGLGSLDRS